MSERFLDITDPAARGNLKSFAAAALRLDEAAVIRLRRRADGLVAAWASTGFDVLAGRAVAGTLQPSDTTAGADALLAGLENHAGGRIELGFSMDSAWRGALPSDHGFSHVDDVPARVLIDLAQRGAALAKEQSGARPPVSLLDQEVLAVEAAGVRVGVPMRVVFALTAMGFVPSAVSTDGTGDVDLDRIDPDEMVRVRASASWLRLDGRYGSVARRTGGGIPLLVTR